MPETLQLFHQPTLRLPKDLPDPHLHFARMRVSNGGDEAELLVAYDRYKLWMGRDGRVHWAEISWPDDGIGMCNHGNGSTIIEAVKGCYQHKKIRDQL